MLPEDLENIIFEFHDRYGTIKNRYHINLIIKSAFGEFRQNTSCYYHIVGDASPRRLEWYRLMFTVHEYDKRLVKIRHDRSCYSKLWSGYVPWD